MIGRALGSTSGYQDFKYRGVRDYTERFASFSIPTYGRPDIAYGFYNLIHNKKVSEELRLSSNETGPIRYVTGVFYTDETTGLTQDILPLVAGTGASLPNLQPLLHAPISATYEEYAAFANVTWKINDIFSIETGGRISHNRQSSRETDFGVFAGGPFVGKSHESPFTYSVSPKIKLSPDMMLYGRVSTGYRAGGPVSSPPPGVPSEFGADKIRNYEIGFKGDLADRKVSLAIAGYYIDWDNIQANVSDPLTGNVYITNAGKARSKGVEGSLDIRPIHGLNLSVSAAYIDAHLAENRSSNSLVYGLKGDPLPYVAKWSATAVAEYRWNQSSGISPFIGATFAYISKRATDFVDDASIARFFLPSYKTVDLRAGADINDFEITLFIKNVADSRGYVGTFPITSRGPYSVTLINPRTVGLSLSTHF